MKDMKCIVLSSCLLFTMFIVNCSTCYTHEFGRNCAYQCHCRTGGCDQRGICNPPGDCEDGWGGIHCSYRDAAFNKVNPLTDNNRATCLDSFSKILYRFKMREETKLTLIRFNLKKQNVSDDATISFEDSSGKTVVPTFLSKIVDGYTVDLIGSLKKKFKYITIVFKAWANKQYFCGMFVSGGRNVAFKQPTRLSSNYLGCGGEFAVDGFSKVDPRLCSRTHSEEFASFNLWPRLPIDVNVMEIYNTITFADFRPCRLKHFHLYLFTEKRNWDTLAQSHVDKGGKKDQMVYTVQGTTFEPIRRIWLGIDKTYWINGSYPCHGRSHSNILAICEFEVYGEVLCTVGRYGYDCEKRCDSRCDWGCHVETGYCNDCEEGRSGKYCEIVKTTESSEPSSSNATSQDQDPGLAVTD